MENVYARISMKQYSSHSTAAWVTREVGSHSLRKNASAVMLS